MDPDRPLDARPSPSPPQPSSSSSWSSPSPQRIDLLWPQVHTLTLLARLGSFTQVAQRLGISKAAASQRLAELERDVGQTLVQRTTRSVRLTDAGQRLVATAADAFAQIARGVAEVRDQAAEPRGLVRVTAPVALGRQRVAPAIEAFCLAQPDVRVELDLNDRLVTLAHEGFDLAIRHVGAPPDNHVAWRLCGSRSVIAASPAYLKRRGTPRHPSELAGHDCLTYLRSGRATWAFERADVPRATGSGLGARDDGVDRATAVATAVSAPAPEPERIDVPVGGPLAANNSEVLRDAALAGLGVALLPDFSAQAGLRGGRLRLLLPDWRPAGVFGDAVWAIRPWSPHTPKAVQALVAHLRSALADDAAAVPEGSDRKVAR